MYILPSHRPPPLPATLGQVLAPVLIYSSSPIRESTSLTIRANTPTHRVTCRAVSTGMCHRHHRHCRRHQSQHTDTPRHVPRCFDGAVPPPPPPLPPPPPPSAPTCAVRGGASSFVLWLMSSTMVQRPSRSLLMLATTLSRSSKAALNFSQKSSLWKPPADALLCCAVRASFLSAISRLRGKGRMRGKGKDRVLYESGRQSGWGTVLVR